VLNGTSDSALRALLAGVTVIALDWNGTTVSDIERAMKATNLVLSRRNFPVLTRAAFRATFMLPMHRYFENLGIPLMDIPNATDEWNATNAAEVVDLSKGIRRLLEIASARDFPVGIISAASSNVVLSDAHRLGIADRLAFVRGDSASKSAVLLELSDLYEGKVLYCGDTEYDIHEALHAEAIAVAFGGGYRPSAALLAAGANCAIDSFDTLASALMVEN
jgi:phosphoglycolate phosphatase-like HAD superfamily hydrolase